MENCDEGERESVQRGGEGAPCNMKRFLPSIPSLFLADMTESPLIHVEGEVLFTPAPTASTQAAAQPYACMLHGQLDAGNTRKAKSLTEISLLSFVLST